MIFEKYILRNCLMNNLYLRSLKLKKEKKSDLKQILKNVNH